MRRFAVYLWVVISGCYPWVSQEQHDENNLDCVWFPDVDRDGFGDLAAYPTVQCEDPGDGSVHNGGDCDDTDATRFPGAPERCDGVPNDCDHGGTPEAEFDVDADGYVACVLDVPLEDWRGPQYIVGGGDCKPTDADVRPDLPEQCDDKDNNCNGQVDEHLIFMDWFVDLDGDGEGDINGAPETRCSDPVDGTKVSNATDCDDTDPTVHSDADELCDGKDNDCNGAIDDGLDFDLWFEDSDKDGFGDQAGLPVSLCSEPVDRVMDSSDCNDQDVTVFPGAAELCDGQDNACIGTIRLVEVDHDGDHRVTCQIDPGGWDGEVSVTGGDDCDDEDDSVYAGAIELCDGLDNNCDGVLPTMERDEDFGGGDHYVPCEIDPGGWDGDPSIEGGDDCDAVTNTVHPNAPELCDGLDNDCDSVLRPDERDLDGDFYVRCALDVLGWAGVVGGLDCDDSDETVHPGGVELCDGLDNNCDGELPSGEADADSDGHVACVRDVNGWDCASTTVALHDPRHASLHAG